MYGLHLNAEIGFLTTQVENLFKTLKELQPRGAGEAAQGGTSRDEQVNKLKLLETFTKTFYLSNLQHIKQES